MNGRQVLHMMSKHDVKNSSEVRGNNSLHDVKKSKHQRLLPQSSGKRQTISSQEPSTITPSLYYPSYIHQSHCTIHNEYHPA